MKIKIRLFIFSIICLFSIYLVWIHAYDVFYNGLSSTLFGGDAVKYLKLGFEKPSLIDLITSLSQGSLGSLFSLYGIVTLSLIINNIFGSWALYGSVLINLLIVYISYYILDRSYNLYLSSFKENALILTYIFPAILLYIVGPNKEVFSFLSCSILIRLSVITSLQKNNFQKFKNEIFLYLIIFLSLTFFREIYLAIGILSIPLIKIKSNLNRFLFIYFVTIIFYFIRPEDYLNNPQLLNQQSSSIILLFERYFDGPFTFIIQIFGRYLIAVMGILYPARIFQIFEGNIYYLIRLLFCVSFIVMFINLFKLKNFKVQRFKLSQLSKNLLYSLVIFSMLFSLSNYNSGRKIIPSYPIIIALTASLLKDKKENSLSISRN
tara:strand:- start:885 stop:2018 length:1134 start_codon:yes stop_codon:yes gene_type:complete